MSLKDNSLLPGFVLQMEQMDDLLQAEDTELDLIHTRAQALGNQLVISTSDILLTRHEQIMGLQTDMDATVEERRSRLIAKLLGQGTATKELFRRVAASFSNGEVEIIEHPAECRFDVRFIGALGTPPNLDGLTVAIHDIKPAHLSFGYLYRYLLIREIHEVMTVEELEQQTLDKFAF